MTPPRVDRHRGAADLGSAVIFCSTAYKITNNRYQFKLQLGNTAADDPSVMRSRTYKEVSLSADFSKTIEVFVIIQNDYVYNRHSW